MASLAIIFDADTFIYKAARRAEVIHQWDEDTFTHDANLPEAIADLHDMVDTIAAGLGEDPVIYMALSDYDEPNFRLQFDPAYKTHREKDGIRRPLLWTPLREYITERDRQDWRTYQRPSLEGDDVCGILATKPKGEQIRVIVSIDKDMRTVPGLHLNPDKVDDWRALWDSVEEVTPEEAAQFHLIQTLAGDPTDGYVGAPGIGMKTAAKMLEERIQYIAVEHELQRGPRKGEVETRWVAAEEPGTDWDIVVSGFQKAGLIEEDALRNARLAYILQADDYNFKTQEVRPWNPPKVD